MTCSKLIINELGRCLTRPLDQIMPILLSMNKHHFQSVFTAAFCFAHAEYNLNKLKLYNNWSVQAVNDISESAT